MTGKCRCAGLAAALLLSLAIGAAGQSPHQTPIFEWSMPSRFGSEHDNLGRLVETRPDQVEAGPWEVDLHVTAPACAPGASYTWTLDGQPADAKRVDECTFSLEVPKEGRYTLRLDASAGGAAYTETQPLNVQDWLIVSIGDSVASGEAVPDVPDFGHAVWQSVRCHRSARSGTAKAALRIEDDDSHSSVTFVHLACSGATVPKGLTGPYGGVEEPPDEPPLPAQVDELNDIQRRRPVDAVLLSVGANDLGFGDVAYSCAMQLVDECYKRPFLGATGPDAQRPIEDVVAGRVRALPGLYDSLDARVSPDIERDRIHPVQYFDPTHDVRGNTCPALAGFTTAPEVDWAREHVLEPLNKAFADAAARHGWQEVTGVAQLFRDHGYCARSQAWVTTLSQSFIHLGGRFKGRFFGTLHPNEAGHEHTAELIAAALERQFYPGVTFTSVPRPPAPPAHEDGGLPALAIAGIVVAGVLLLAGAGALGFVLGRKAAE